MTIEIISPELEHLLQDGILRGRFQSLDDFLLEAVHALEAVLQEKAMREKAAMPHKDLAQFLLDSPFAGSDLDLERQQDFGRSIDL